MTNPTKKAPAGAFFVGFVIPGPVRMHHPGMTKSDCFLTAQWTK
jgi:hypothetical protein